jgi:hypothetical protein
MKKFLLVLLFALSFNAYSENFESTSDGTWSGNNWSPSPLLNLADKDTITMNHYISISGNNNLSGLDLVIIINDTFNLSGGNNSFLKLGAFSQIILNGTMISDASGGNDNKIRIGSNLYSESDLINFPSGTTLMEGGALPVELLYFSAAIIKDAVVLNWETGSEKNNDYFTIEKSDDLEYWQVVSYVLPRSDGKYQYTDNISEDIYYRLTQTDIDGTLERLEIQRINLNYKLVEGFKMDSDEKILSFKVYDINGQVVTQDYSGFKIVIIQTNKQVYNKKVLDK